MEISLSVINGIERTRFSYKNSVNNMDGTIILVLIKSAANAANVLLMSQMS